MKGAWLGKALLIWSLHFGQDYIDSSISCSCANKNVYKETDSESRGRTTVWAASDWLQCHARVRVGIQTCTPATRLSITATVGSSYVPTNRVFLSIGSHGQYYF